jgi:hypothetical protein
MIKIEMLDDEGRVLETVPATETDERCETVEEFGPAACASGGWYRAYAFTSGAAKMEYKVCRPCIDRDEYTRSVEFLKIRVMGETVDAAVHFCSPDACEEPVFCEGCGRKGDRVAIFVFSVPGLDFFQCRMCIEGDETFKIVTESDVAPKVAPAVELEMGFQKEIAALDARAAEFGPALPAPEFRNDRD